MVFVATDTETEQGTTYASQNKNEVFIREQIKSNSEQTQEERRRKQKGPQASRAFVLCFFFSLIPSVIFVLPLQLHPCSVTLARGNMASTLSPYPLRRMLPPLSREKSTAFSSLVDSRLIVRRHATNRRLLQANLGTRKKNRPTRWVSNSRNQP